MGMNEKFVLGENERSNQSIRLPVSGTAPLDSRLFPPTNKKEKSFCFLFPRDLCITKMMDGFAERTECFSDFFSRNFSSNFLCFFLPFYCCRVGVPSGAWIRVAGILASRRQR